MSQAGSPLPGLQNPACEIEPSDGAKTEGLHFLISAARGSPGLDIDLGRWPPAAAVRPGTAQTLECPCSCCPGHMEVKVESEKWGLGKRRKKTSVELRLVSLSKHKPSQA